MFQEWKSEQRNDYCDLLINLGFLPEVAEAFAVMLDEKLETAYQYGLTYNAEKD